MLVKGLYENDCVPAVLRLGMVTDVRLQFANVEIPISSIFVRLTVVRFGLF